MGDLSSVCNMALLYVCITGFFCRPHAGAQVFALEANPFNSARRPPLISLMRADWSFRERTEPVPSFVSEDMPEK